MNSMSALTFGIQAFVTLFVIMDPPGVSPIFLSIIGTRPKNEVRRLAIQAALTSLVVITTFALFGRLILNYLNISIQAMQIAGGLLLLMVSLELLSGKESEERTVTNANVAMVPLGTPLLAGPGAIVAIMIFVQKINGSGQSAALIAATILIHAVIAVVLISSASIVRVIGKSGITLVARIAGLLCASIAVQMLVDAITTIVGQGSIS
jgi:multiple antibiotic resistance protein